MGKCFSTKNENKTQQNYKIINNININNNGANYYYNTNPTYISERNIPETETFDYTESKISTSSYLYGSQAKGLSGVSVVLDKQ